MGPTPSSLQPYELAYYNRLVRYCESFLRGDRDRGSLSHHLHEEIPTLWKRAYLHGMRGLQRLFLVNSVSELDEGSRLEVIEAVERQLPLIERLVRDLERSRDEGCVINWRDSLLHLIMSSRELFEAGKRRKGPDLGKFRRLKGGSIKFYPPKRSPWRTRKLKRDRPVGTRMSYKGRGAPTKLKAATKKGGKELTKDQKKKLGIPGRTGWLYYWKCLEDDASCESCIFLARYSPFTRDNIPTTPRAARPKVKCRKNCRCELEMKSVPWEMVRDRNARMNDRKWFQRQLAKWF